ncbi:MAG: pantoate--beta-alanine ligase [Verrucomicrobiota bacterium]
MIKFHDIDLMRKKSAAVKRSGLSIGLVPTMGSLHPGHVSLIRRARAECDFLVVSIFVNPAQFAPNEDFDNYPRDMAGDEAICAREGADAVFVPDADDMYDPEHSVYVDEQDISQGLCGASRPGHFRGVLTVVAKLFNIVDPDVAIFGEKDIQQLRLIQKMAHDLNFPVKILAGRTLREDDGLALSSRNRYLSDAERNKALRLHEALEAARSMIESGERDSARILKKMNAIIKPDSDVRPDYLECVDYHTLRRVNVISGKTVVALAVKVGRTRLIDNVVAEPPNG